MSIKLRFFADRGGAKNYFQLPSVIVRQQWGGRGKLMRWNSRFEAGTTVPHRNGQIEISLSSGLDYPANPYVRYEGLSHDDLIVGFLGSDGNLELRAFHSDLMHKEQCRVVCPDGTSGTGCINCRIGSNTITVCC